MRANVISTAVALLAGAAVVTACGPADGGPSISPTPTFSTIPSTPPVDTGYAAQTMRDFWYAHDRCGNSGNSGLPIDPVQCSRASGMMSTLPSECVSGYPDRPDDVQKCAEALRSSAKPSAAPATATAALHDDPTASMSDVEMIHVMNTSLPRSLTATLDWKGTRGMGSLVMQDYQARDTACKASEDYIRYCAARDVLRSTLPSRCVVEAERVPARADGPGLCGAALLYVKHMPSGGGK